MKKVILLMAIVLFQINFGSAQTSWEKLYGGFNYDIFRCVIEVPSGGYIAAGYTSYNSAAIDSDGWVVRLTAAGDTIWTFNYNGPTSRKDLFYKVINTIDNGFALCGYTTSVNGVSDDIIILKLNSSGQQQWVKFFGGSGKDRAQDIIQTADGNYEVVGYTTTAPAQYYDAFLLRTNSLGDSLWMKRYGLANYDDANSVQALSDGGFILGGQSFNGVNGFDQYLIRTNSTGDTLWTKRNGTPSTDNIECIRVLADGYIMAGSTNTVLNGDNGYLVRTDTSGTVLWTKSLGDTVPDDFHSVGLTTDGGFIVGGTTSSTGPVDDLGNRVPKMWLVRTNSLGDTLWTRAFGGHRHEHGYSCQQTSDGGFILAGKASSFGLNVWDDGYIVKTDSSGNIADPLTYISAYDLLTPANADCGSANTQIKVVIKNFGRTTVLSIPITIQITGSLNTTINQTYNANFYAEKTDTVTINTTINTLAGGTYTFYCFTGIVNDVCPVRNSFTKTITIFPYQTAPTVTGDSICGNGSLLLSASASGTIYWFTSSSGGTSVNTGTTYNTPVLNSTTTYYVQSGLSCPSSRTPVVATVTPRSTDPVTVSNGSCGSGTVTLSATASDPITWYNAPTGGSVVGSGNSFTTPFLTTTTNYYALSTNGICPSNRMIATALISSVANDPQTFSNDNCGTGTVLLSAASPDPIVWFDAASGGTQVGTGLTFTTPVISSTTTYYAQADNGCLSNRVAVVATINPLATDPITTPGHSCGPGIVTLTATTGNLVIWYDAPTNGNQVGVGLTFVSPIIFNTTTYYAVANDGTCPSNRIATVASILSPPPINLGTDTVVNSISYFVDAGVGFSSYLWSTGETTSGISVQATDSYCVTVTDANGCTNNDCIFVDIINGVSELDNNNRFSVYPNPNTGKLSIRFLSSHVDSKIELMTIEGKVIRFFKVDEFSSETEIDLSAYSKGMYLLKLSNRGYSQMKKIVIQ